jgi:hypothetical protein
LFVSRILAKCIGKGYSEAKDLLGAGQKAMQAGFSLLLLLLGLGRHTVSFLGLTDGGGLFLVNLWTFIFLILFILIVDGDGILY